MRKGRTERKTDRLTCSKEGKVKIVTFTPEINKDRKKAFTITPQTYSLKSPKCSHLCAFLFLQPSKVGQGVWAPLSLSSSPAPPPPAPIPLHTLTEFFQTDGKMEVWKNLMAKTHPPSSLAQTPQATPGALAGRARG